MTFFRSYKILLPRLSFAFFLTLVQPFTASALTFSEARETAALFLLGFIGLFGAVALSYFFAGWGLYIARRGTEYRNVGIFKMMMPAVRMMFAIMCLAILLYFIEK